MTLKTFLLGVFTLMVWSPNAYSDSAIETAQKAILGEWEFQSSASWNPAFVVVEREHYFADGTVSGTYTLRRSSGSKAIIYQTNWKSRYFFESAVPALDAVAVYFEAVSKSVRVESRDPLLLMQAQINDCKLKPGVAVDFAKYSCPQISRSIEQCPKEYQIVQITPTRLRFGATSDDRNNCSAKDRPRSLDTAFFSKVRP